MSASARSLYIVRTDPDPGDPLDVVARAMPHLMARYRQVRLVMPGARSQGDAALTLRGLRRGFRNGRDRILFDFTSPDTAAWAGEMARSSVGAILCGPARLPLQTGLAPALVRARQRYRGLLRDAFARRRVVALEATIPETGARLVRPQLPKTALPEILLPRAALPGAGSTASDETGREAGPRYEMAAVCAPGGAAETYGLLAAWHAQQSRPPDADGGGLLVSVATAADAAQVHGYRTFLGPAERAGRVDIMVRSRRADLVDIAREARVVVDLDRFSWPGRTDALAAADAVGRPRMRLTAPLSDIAGEVTALLQARPAPIPEPSVSEEEFASDLADVIEYVHAAAGPGAPVGGRAA